MVALGRDRKSTYRAFAVENRRLLAFGFLAAFCSSFGQTFFISLFSAEIRAEFGLSDGDFGTLYSAATLVSGFSLIWLGRKIDQLDLRLYSALVGIAFVAACLLMASAASTVALVLAIFMLRLTGQGLMSHIAVTSMARYFEAGRGKAISIASFGFPAGEALFPTVAVLSIAAIGWRETWIAISMILTAVLVPLLLWLLKGHAARDRGLRDRLLGVTPGAAGESTSWSRRQMLRDPRFYLILPAALAPSFIVTGLFFHQVHLAQSKGWSMAWVATCFIGFAFAQGITVLQTGPLVDRIGAVRLLPYFLMPLASGLLVLWAFDHPGAALIYLMAMGVTSGMSATIVTAVWAELYGVLHLGAIRALAAALSVLSSALSPVSIGWMIDRGVSMETVALLCLAYLGLAILLVLPVVRARSAGAASSG